MKPHGNPCPEKIMHHFTREEWTLALKPAFLGLLVTATTLVFLLLPVGLAFAR